MNVPGNSVRVAVGVFSLFLCAVNGFARESAVLNKDVHEVYVPRTLFWRAPCELLCQLQIPAIVEIGFCGRHRSGFRGDLNHEGLSPRLVPAFEMTTGTVRDALDGFCDSNGVFRWFEKDGVIHIRRLGTTTDIEESLWNSPILPPLRDSFPFAYVAKDFRITMKLYLNELLPYALESFRRSLHHCSERAAVVRIYPFESFWRSLHDDVEFRCYIEGPPSVGLEGLVGWVQERTEIRDWIPGDCLTQRCIILADEVLKTPDPTATIHRALADILMQSRQNLIIVTQGGGQLSKRLDCTITNYSRDRAALDTRTLADCVLGNSKELFSYACIGVRDEDFWLELDRRMHFHPKETADVLCRILRTLPPERFVLIPKITFRTSDFLSPAAIVFDLLALQNEDVNQEIADVILRSPVHIAEVLLDYNIISEPKRFNGVYDVIWETLERHGSERLKEVARHTIRYDTERRISDEEEKRAVGAPPEAEDVWIDPFVY